MTLNTIAVMSPGDMGHAVGRTLRESGFRVLTSLDGRSGDSRARAERAGLEDAGTLADLVAQSDLMLSIMPPSAALGFARDAAEAMNATGAAPIYADCNAVSPTTSGKVGDIVTAAGAAFVDGGIIGPPPGRAAAARLYVSGPRAEELLPLDGPELKIRPLGPQIGRASALKMSYAALTKGTMTLDTAALLAGKQLGVYEELREEFSTSQAAAFERMEKRVPWLAADSGRWVGEMEEIAATFADAGLPPGFHQAAAEIFRFMAETAMAEETRETADRSRTLDEAVEQIVEAVISPPRAAQ